MSVMHRSTWTLYVTKLAFFWVKPGKWSSWTETCILSLPEKHHLDHQPSCTRHHLEPDLNSPCSGIQRLWAWRLYAVVPGQFGHCNGQHPSRQLGGDSKQYQLCILRSHVRHDISKVQSQTLWVCMMPNCGSRQVTNNPLSPFRLTGLVKPLESLPLQLSHDVRSAIASFKETFPRTLIHFFRQANFDRCNDSCIDAMPSFHFSLKQVAQLQSPWW